LVVLSKSGKGEGRGGGKQNEDGTREVIKVLQRGGDSREAKGGVWGGKKKKKDLAGR